MLCAHTLKCVVTSPWEIGNWVLFKDLIWTSRVLKVLILWNFEVLATGLSQIVTGVLFCDISMADKYIGEKRGNTFILPIIASYTIELITYDYKRFSPHEILLQ